MGSPSFNDQRRNRQFPSGRVLRRGDPVVTFVARNLEPYRGFHVFMRALPAILAAHPTCQIVIVGGDKVSYGGPPDDAPDWRTRMLREVELDPGRVHFLGRIPNARYRCVLQVSSVHVYLTYPFLTYPFVLSWSMLEAMACGCVVVASRTAPVTEVITDGDNGLLVDFFDRAALAERVGAVLSDQAGYEALRRRAMACARAHYSAEQGIAAYEMLINQSS